MTQPHMPLNPQIPKEYLWGLSTVQQHWTTTNASYEISLPSTHPHYENAFVALKWFNLHDILHTTYSTSDRHLDQINSSFRVKKMMFHEGPPSYHDGGHIWRLDSPSEHLTPKYTRRREWIPVCKIRGLGFNLSQLKTKSTLQNETDIAQLPNHWVNILRSNNQIVYRKDVLFVPNVTISPSFKEASLPGRELTGFEPSFLFTNVPNLDKSCTLNDIRGMCATSFMSASGAFDSSVIRFACRRDIVLSDWMVM